MESGVTGFKSTSQRFTQPRGLDAGGCMGRVMTWLAVAGVLAALYVAYRYGVF